MKIIRRIIYVLSVLIGLWVLVSFGGAMFNTANAEFWTTSLIWAMLSFLLVMPALVVINHASTQAEKKAAQATTEPPSSPSQTDQERFLEEENKTLWPETEGTEWPPEGLSS